MDNFLFWPRALAAALFDAAFAGAIGALLAHLWLNQTPVSQPDSIQARLRRVLVLCSSAMVLALPAQMWLTTATVLGSSSYAAVRAEFWDVVTETHAGRVLVPDFALAALLLAVAITRPLLRRRAGLALALAIVTTLTAFRSATGHAAGDGNFSIPEAMQFLHLASIAIWAGSVMVAGWFVFPGMTPDATTRIGKRLSTTATWAIVAVALSGIYNAWRGLGLGEPGASLSPLLHTQWGGLLSLKSALVAFALLLGLENRLLLGRNPQLTDPDAKSFALWMRIEAWVMAAILVLSGFLANSPPANGQ
jgi:putative copper resistance protein D